MANGELNYETIRTLAAGTFTNVMTRPGSKYGIVNEVKPHTMLFSRMFKRCKQTWDTGVTLSFDVQFKRSRVGQWVGPTTKLAMKGTQAPTRGVVPRRFYGWSWFKSFAELDHNKGEKEVTIDCLKQAKEDCSVDAIVEFEDVGWARDGNYAHDATGAEHLLPFSLFYWATIDGLHVTGDTTKAVGGIIPAATGDLANWRNNFINPVTSSDGLGACTTVYELREAYQRAMRMQRWPSVKAYGELTSPISDADTWDPDGPEDPSKDFMIICDAKTEIKYGSIVFDREDQVGKDQGRGRPVFKGIPIESEDRLGIDLTYGYGYDSSGNALWTDRGGNYASGQWKGYGESIFVNTNYFHVLTHPSHDPYVKPPYIPEGMFGLAMEGDWWLQTCCRSRRKAFTYIGPYAFS